MNPLADIRPLRASPAFRRLWIGTSLSALGGQLANFAAVFYVWEATGSPAVVGALGLAVAVPVLVFALAGGSLADAMDRRRLALLTTICQIAVSAVTALLVLLDAAPVWAMFVLVAASSATSAAGRPARRSLIPQLLAPDQVAAGIALTHASFQCALLGGPALAGLITGLWGVGVCFVLDALAFLAALYGIAGLPRLRPGDASTGEAPAGARAVWRAARFVARRPTVAGALLCDLLATTLAMPIALFPVLNSERFGGTPQTLGLFITALGVGGLVASALSGAMTRYPYPGRVMLAATATWGISLGLVGLVPHLPTSLLLVVLAGAADTVSVISRGTIVQLGTPDGYRGRVTAMEHVVGTAGPHLGNVRAGLVAGAFSGGVAFVVGGAMCLAAVVALVALFPSLRQADLARAAPQSAPAAA